MATYLQGVQDAVQSLRPPNPNLQFDAQLLATRQSKYDQAHSKLSKMYGTILNSGLSREDNIQARDEFFKLIESDLHKIAGMDLSKDSNVNKAQNVFKQIYTNDYLVKDMVWTKHYQGQMQRAEEFKSCIDPEKCGGQYWEDGVKYMQYKREEFRMASQDESMRMGNVDYVPYTSMMEDAIKAFNEVEHEIKIEKVAGAYQVTRSGGELSVGPLTSLFGKLFAQNPKYTEQFKVMAYNARKDKIYSDVASGKYKDVEEATVGYIEETRDQIKANFENTSKEFEHDYVKLKEMSEAFQQDIKDGLYNEMTQEQLEKSKEYQDGLTATDLFSQAETLKNYHDLVKRSQKNMYRINDINQVNDILDNTLAYNELNKEVKNVARIMAQQHYTEEYDVDEIYLENLRFKHDIYLENLSAENDRDLEYIKQKNITSEIQRQAFNAAGNYATTRNKLGNAKANWITSGLSNAMGSDSKELASVLKLIDQSTLAFSGDVAGLNDVANKIFNTKGVSGYLTLDQIKTALQNEQTKVLNLALDQNTQAINAIYYEQKGGLSTDNIYDIIPGQITPEQAAMVGQYATNPNFAKDPKVISLVQQINNGGTDAAKAALNSSLAGTTTASINSNANPVSSLIMAGTSDMFRGSGVLSYSPPGISFGNTTFTPGFNVGGYNVPLVQTTGGNSWRY